ncbi:MAG TPA: hypothetical protein VGI86_09095 [Acidimicrobiia bacterium]|jgi:hypothetical protein
MDLLVKIVIAVVVIVVVYLIGAGFVRGFAQGVSPHGDDDDIPELADVDLRYRCIVCGAEVVMYAAPNGELPMPPRHCAERMALITPVN